MDRESLLALYASFEEVSAALAVASHDALTLSDLLRLAGGRERIQRAQGAVDNMIVARIAAEANPTQMGANSIREVLWRTLRISRDDAGKRIGDAQDVGPRRAVNGEPLPAAPISTN